MTDKERFYKVKEILTEFCQYDCTTMDRWQYVKDNAEIMLGAMERVQELEEENLILKATRAGNEELIDVLYKQNKRYREALEFYAKEYGADRAIQALEGETNE